MALKEHLLNSIKKAMKGEMDSVTLYQNAANHASDPEVKEFFQSRREEERRHYNYLLQYYQEISNDLQPSDLSSDLKDGLNADSKISAEFLRRIGEDQYLFSAISTALLLEKDAIEHYRKCGLETDIGTLRSFYEILEKWEMKHYDDLLVIQKDSEEYYWRMNNFEPF
ncbi:MAG: ferritin family protein [Candidatus Cloacimonadaceae bacterium]|nr:ferritin family protein [Candidatus Cloacimonadaceae bacterium]